MQNNIQYDSFKDGVTVIASQDSPTGYLAVFVFDEKSITREYIDYYRRQYQVDLEKRLDLGNIADVQIYSNTALLFRYDEQAKLTPLDPARTAHNPEEFTEGMYPAGGNTTPELYDNKKIDYVSGMTEFAEGRWGTAIPLLAGCTDYMVRLIDGEGRDDGTYLFDPANPPIYNPLSELYSRSSVVYVPYDANKQPAYCDRAIENPLVDGVGGTLEFTEYDGTDGTKRYLAVYLPIGYDRNREEPYRVVYISHGMQMEKNGCEMRWMHEAAARNILDHLAADFVLVAMNNSDFGWNFDHIWDEQVRLMAHVEEKYNVSTEQKGRAYCGFSMGGMTTSVMYMKHTDSFGWYGIWNAAHHTMLEEMSAEEREALAEKDVKVQVAYGDWDWCMESCQAYDRGLTEMGITHDSLTVPGSHDWKCFSLIFAKAAQRFFFR